VQTGGVISYSRERCLWGGGIFRHDGDVNSYKAVNSMAAAIWGVVEWGLKLDASRWWDGRWSEVRTQRTST
jgi:hypothetical protein